MLDDLSSGTPRAFIYPLFLAFIYYLLRNNLWLCLLAIVLQGLFYPQTVLISAIILLIKLAHVNIQRNSSLLFNRDGTNEVKELRKGTNSFTNYSQNVNITFWLGLITSSIILFFYSLKTSNYEPVVTFQQAQLMTEFMSNGRSEFFTNNWIDFWLLGRRSGWLPIEWQYTLICSFGIVIFWAKRHPKYFPLAKKINHKFSILWQIILASTILFFLAHLLLFRLHLPSRYIHHSLRIVLALVDAIALTIVLEKITKWLNSKYSLLRNFYKYLATIILILLLLMPTYAVQSYPHRLGYITGKATQLYQFLQQQPENYLIATLSKEADNIPSFAARSVLVAEEYAIPYHQGYYQQIRQRAKDLIAAQYSLDKQEIIKFINQYSTDLWLLDTNAFDPEYLQSNQWLKQFTPEITNAISITENERKPVLEKIRDRLKSEADQEHCLVFETNKHMILRSDCLLKLLRKQ